VLLRRAIGNWNDIAARKNLLKRADVAKDTSQTLRYHRQGEKLLENAVTRPSRFGTGLLL
jgi:hypothetical protein